MLEAPSEHLGRRASRSLWTISVALAIGGTLVLLLAQAVGQPSSTCYEEPSTLGGEAGPDVVTGTSGPDIIDGRDGDDVIDGRKGDDCIKGGGGNDTVLGSTGNDNMLGGPGADSMQGGSGDRDRVDYFDHSSAITVTLDEVANDGASGEGDNVHRDVEVVDGGAPGTKFVGNAAANTLRSNGGETTLDGREGDDILRSGSGANTLLGGAGNDTLDTGAPGAGDNLFGQSGADTLLLRDGERGARADCGPRPTRLTRLTTSNPDPGDVAELDPRDAGATDPAQPRIPTPGCELVKIEPVGEGPNVTISLRARRLSEAGIVSVQMRCPRPAPPRYLSSGCSGRLRLRTVHQFEVSTRQRVALGSRRYRIKPGQKKLVRVRLSRRKRSLVRRLRRVRVEARTVEKGKRGPKITIANFLLRASG